MLWGCLLYTSKHSGIANMYLPVERKNRDTAVFCGQKLLKNADWLKGILSYISVGTLTNVCSIEEILTDMMSNPSQEKIWYYEQYYQKTKRLPHAIVVDEDRQLRDGYISYLLAKKYNVHADVCEMVSGQPLRKTVSYTHLDVYKRQDLDEVAENRMSWGLFRDRRPHCYSKITE